MKNIHFSLIYNCHLLCTVEMLLCLLFAFLRARIILRFRIPRVRMGTTPDQDWDYKDRVFSKILLSLPMNRVLHTM